VVSDLVAVDVLDWCEEDGQPELLHIVLCEKHYGDWCMDADSPWSLCENDGPLHAPQDYCDTCDSTKDLVVNLE
jgi:hypothetical protein